MAGTHSSHVYTMEEVLGMLDTIDEPICDGSDDDFDTDCLNYDDQEMTTAQQESRPNRRRLTRSARSFGHVFCQMQLLLNTIAWNSAMYRAAAM